MRFRGIIALAACILGGLTGIAEADLVYPARLQIDERESGIYDIVFSLPMVQGRILRAEPMLPPSCTDITVREVKTTSTGRTTTWSTHCEPASLAGEAIIVEGLFGTQADLAFKLTTLDGRVFDQILRPSRPGFLVPVPPSFGRLASGAVAAGMRHLLAEPLLWLLLMTAALQGGRHRRFAAAAGAFAASYALGQWLSSSGWLEISLPARSSFVLISIAVPAAGLAGAGDRWRGWLRPLWPVALLLGALYGGSNSEALPAAGLSSTEQVLFIALHACGVGLGLLLVAAIANEANILIRLIREGRLTDRLQRILATGIGGLATGMLLAQVMSLGLMPEGLRQAPFEIHLFAAALGLSLAISGKGDRVMVLPFAALVLIGGAIGLARIPLVHGSLIVLGSMIVLGIALATGRSLPARWLGLTALISVPAHAWFMASTLAANTSRAEAFAAGSGLVAVCVLYGGLTVGERLAGALPPIGIRMYGAVVATIATVLRLAEYRMWFDREVATEAAVGLLRLPVFASLLFVAAVIAWPKRHRALRALGIEQPRRRAHWILLGAAFLLVPVGTIAVNNPAFSAHAPRGESARRVMERVLSRTYEAFNLEDEDELFDRLGENVAVEMIGDLYLDSRRRLMAGTREGTEVTVREVRVLDIGEPVNAYRGDSAVSYDCRWLVVARVRHLQHIHHRRNTYQGVLTLQLEDRHWKIAGIELFSEDRAVVAWGS